MQSSTDTPSFRIIKTALAGIALFAAFNVVLSLPYPYLGIITAACAGFAIFFIGARELASSDAWLFVPAAWGATLCALLFTASYARTEPPFAFGWTLTLLFGAIAIVALAADKAGYDFRGRRVGK